MRAVPYNQIKEFAYDRGLGYIEVSAKTGKNINQSFECLTHQVYDLTSADMDFSMDESVDNKDNQKGSKISSVSKGNKNSLVLNGSRNNIRNGQQ